MLLNFLQIHVFQYSFCTFLLAQKSTKKGHPKSPPAGRAGMYSPISGSSFIELQFSGSIIFGNTILCCKLSDCIK